MLRELLFADESPVLVGGEKGNVSREEPNSVRFDSTQIDR